ncbi:uncharacterized protein BYT42DRAFT_647962 [Radiomyces spectabilis]|uniref:uncharacterized protein n=1 Tax=Radiomyces spectabilis TaxID=64574 RepID=UPI0022205ADA|nr:uncharacterized protein BYT42DRAFT_647962 [Radiomyces spectabilis]KAI8369252.1 hypothetical protein BYT42DRAFT_647962 [Radiomyces spectabilis]
MPTVIDARGTPSSQQSFLYQQQPPPSPIVTPNILSQQQPQQSQPSPLPSLSSSPQPQHHRMSYWDDDQETESLGSRYDDANLDYMVSPRPSSSRLNSDSKAHNEDSATMGLDSSNGHDASVNKRKTASLSRRQSSSNSMVKLSKVDPMLNQNMRETCTMSHGAISNPMVCQHFQCHMKQSKHHTNATTSLSSHAVSPPTQASSSSGPTATSPIPTAPHTRFSKNNKQTKSQKKERLKLAKSDYEARIERYFHQLTVGCGQSDCTNRFCATGRGGILSTNPQATLIISIQLASKPESRFCTMRQNNSHTTCNNISSCSSSSSSSASCSSESPGSIAHVLLENFEKRNVRPVKPFLQSLFTSAAFLSIFGITPKQEKSHVSSTRRRKSSHSSAFRKNHVFDETSPDQAHWISEIWSMLGLRGKEHEVSSHAKKAQETEARSADVDESYYELDSEGTASSASLSVRSLDSVDDSDTSDDEMLLAIRPISVGLQGALKRMQRYSETNNVDRMSRWCRGIFQNWEGIGNSFLTSKVCDIPRLPYPIQLANLADVYSFYNTLLNRCHHHEMPDNDGWNQLHGRTVEAVSESLETLLDRMEMNVDSLVEITTAEEADPNHLRIIIEWCRSLICMIAWINSQRQSTRTGNQYADPLLASSSRSWTKNARKNTWPTILSSKFIQVMSKINASRDSMIRHILLQLMMNVDERTIHDLVDHLQQHLVDHFHTGPYKHGERDTLIMTVKCLELFYEANVTFSIIPLDVFYNNEICKKLNVKDEYRIWKRVLQHGEGRHSASAIASMNSPAVEAFGHRYRRLNEQQRRTCLFLTTTSTSSLLPYPFANEYQFSWFSYPFLLPPSIKRKILHIDAMSQMSLEYEDACVNHTLVVHAQRLLSDAPRMVRNLEANLKSATCPYLLLEIRREHFIDDTIAQVSRKWGDLKKPLKVKFVEGGEEGMDQGGVQKEFFGVLFERLVDPTLGLFEIDPETRLCWIRRMVKPDLRMYEMVGVMMGLAIYNGIIMNLQFPKIFWKLAILPNEAAIEEMMHRGTLFTLNDLQDGWPELKTGLSALLNWEGDVEDVFCRNYEMSLDVFGEDIVTVPLTQGGEAIPITNENRESYVRDYCKYFLYTSQREPILALRRGLWSVIGSTALDLCTADELEMVACGLRLDLDMGELEEVAEYDDGYSADHPTIQRFWSVVHRDLTEEQKRKLLLFVTASDRVPVGGLKELTFVVQRNGPDSDRLPTALTCFCRLLLPEYVSREKLRDRLITAIENAKGFGLV